MSSRFDEIRKREELASKGPWETGVFEDRVYLDEDHCIDCDCSSDSHVQDCDNAIFIANARDDIPFLLGEVERLQKQLNAAEMVIEGYLVNAKIIDAASHILEESLKEWRRLKDQTK